MKRLRPSRGFDVLLAVLLFLPTIGITQTNRLFIVAVAVCGFRWVKTGIKLIPSDLIYLTFFGGAYLNLLLTVFTTASHPTGRDFAIGAMFITVLVGRTISPRTADWLVALIAFEAVCCVWERLAGVPALLPGQTDTMALAGFYQNSDYLYHSRVLGLSQNSSVAAGKFLIAVLLLQRSMLRLKWRLIIAACLAGGFYATFNRTALVAAGLFLFLVLAEGMVRPNVKTPKRLLSAMVLAFLCYGLYVSFQAVYQEFMRGHHTNLVEDSGRLDVFIDGLQFWSEHPIRGNGSTRYETVFGTGVEGHVHNSFLQILCDHGIIAVLLWIYLFGQINRRNWKHAVPILVYSMFQYGIFWNISLMDIAMYHMFWRTRSGVGARPPVLGPVLGLAPIPGQPCLPEDALLGDRCDAQKGY